MAPLEDFQNRYLDELVVAAEELESFESAAQAEAWASGAIAEWRALCGPAGQLAGLVESESPLAAALLRWFDGGEKETVDAPDWWDELGEHELVSVVELSSANDGGEIALIFEYSLGGEPDHDISVSIDNRHLVAVTVGPAGLRDGIEENDRGLVLVEVTEAVGVDAVARALKMPLGELSPASEANIPLLARRFGARAGIATAVVNRILPERNTDDDQWCVDVLRSALRNRSHDSAPDALSKAVTNFADLVDKSDADALTVLGVAGIERTTDISLDVLIRAVGAYFSPTDLSAHSAQSYDALIMLEPVDWLGGVLGLIRSKQIDGPVDGAKMVTFINRAPEITTKISKNEAPQIAWAFDQALFAFETTGVLSGDGFVTDVGRWLLAEAFVTTLSP